MKKRPITSFAALAEKEQMKPFYQSDKKALADLKKAVAAMKKELGTHPAPEIESHSGALKSPLGNIKP